MSLINSINNLTPQQKELLQFVGFEFLKFLSRVREAQTVGNADLDELIKKAAEANKTTIFDTKV